jgi:ParB-like chromosome segregation protein Spo0J
MDEINRLTTSLIGEIEKLKQSEKIEAINIIRMKLHKISPFSNEPVDCVQWVKLDNLEANDYNPNRVAPPEMKLLEHSIREDGYTQPIVAWPKNGNLEVIDGFHRNRVGREINDIKTRIHGYLPVSIINPSRTKRRDRIAATIRHNRARGKHTVDGMSDIVLELKNRNWKNERIARELGMEQDEILRLCQITGLAGLFSDQEFSKSWDVEESLEDFVELEDNAAAYDDEEMKAAGFRTVNTDDENRIFHEWKKWECYKAGFYSTTFEDKKADECEKIYYDFLSDLGKFEKHLKIIISDWKYSCEHYLTNVAMNKIAWLGQAAVCHATGVPSKFRNGFNLLSLDQQERANNLALLYLNKWLKKNGRDEVSLVEALGQGRQMDLY